MSYFVESSCYKCVCVEIFLKLRSAIYFKILYILMSFLYIQRDRQQCRQACIQTSRLFTDSGSWRNAFLLKDTSAHSITVGKYTRLLCCGAGSHNKRPYDMQNQQTVICRKSLKSLSEQQTSLNYLQRMENPLGSLWQMCLATTMLRRKHIFSVFCFSVLSFCISAYPSFCCSLDRERNRGGRHAGAKSCAVGNTNTHA